MFLYKNNFSSFENIWGGPGPPGPMGMTPLVLACCRAATNRLYYYQSLTFSAVWLLIWKSVVQFEFIEHTVLSCSIYSEHWAKWKTFGTPTQGRAHRANWMSWEGLVLLLKSIPFVCRFVRRLHYYKFFMNQSCESFCRDVKQILLKNTTGYHSKSTMAFWQGTPADKLNQKMDWIIHKCKKTFFYVFLFLPRLNFFILPTFFYFFFILIFFV